MLNLTFFGTDKPYQLRGFYSPSHEKALGTCFTMNGEKVTMFASSLPQGVVWKDFKEVRL